MSKVVEIQYMRNPCLHGKVIVLNYWIREKYLKLLSNLLPYENRGREEK